PRSAWEWWEQYLKGAKDGEERQRREKEFEGFERQWYERREQWYELQEREVGYREEPWRPGGIAPGDRGLQIIDGRYDRSQSRQVNSEVDIERNGFGLGKVGTWNAHYPKQTGPGKAKPGETRPDASSAGPGARR